MKKHSLGIVFCFLTFVIGVFVADSFEVSERQFVEENKTEIEIDTSHKNTKQIKTIDRSNLTGRVEINFREFIQSNDETFIIFGVKNRTKNTVFYTDYEGREANEVISPVFNLKINGKDKQISWCGTGMTSYSIESGNSEIFQINLRPFADKWKKGSKIQIGFFMAKESEKEYQTVWSDVLPISKEIEKYLSDEKAEMEKLSIE